MVSTGSRNVDGRGSGQMIASTLGHGGGHVLNCKDRIERLLRAARQEE
jgi:hypothetical protein